MNSTTICVLDRIRALQHDLGPIELGLDNSPDLVGRYLLAQDMRRMAADPLLSVGGFANMLHDRHRVSFRRMASWLGVSETVLRRWRKN